jgi:hypothetical protein
VDIHSNEPRYVTTLWGNRNKSEDLMSNPYDILGKGTELRRMVFDLFLIMWIPFLSDEFDMRSHVKSR